MLPEVQKGPPKASPGEFGIFSITGPVKHSHHFPHTLTLLTLLGGGEMCSRRKHFTAAALPPTSLRSPKELTALVRFLKYITSFSLYEWAGRGLSQYFKRQVHRE